MNAEIGGYKVTDIEPVAAFDINSEKVGKDLSEAIFTKPNNAYKYPDTEIKHYDVKVKMGPVLDSYPQHFKEYFSIK